MGRIFRPFLASLALFGLSSAGLMGEDTWLSGGTSSPAPVWNGQTALPEGLAVIQLKGNLVCPPLRVTGRGVLVACDDRTVKLVSESGDLVWSLDTDRLIRGPLFPLTDSMALVALSGEQIAAFRLDGRIVWQQRVEGSLSSWFLGLPDGRLIQAFTDGRIRYCNPDGSTLFTCDLKSTVLPVPRLVDGGVEFRLAGGATARLLYSGELEAPRMAGTSAVAVQPAPVPGNVVFSSTRPDGGSYVVHVSSPGAVLDFSSKGEIGHWLLDNRLGGLAVWGDSLWRCFIYRPPEARAAAAAQAAPAAPRYGFSGYFSELRGSAELEWRYLQAIMRENPAGGSREVLDHVGQAVHGQRLAGRLQFYEDVLSVLIERQLEQVVPDASLLAECLKLMGSFPSLRHLPRVAELLKRTRDEVVIQSCLEYFARLGSDPDGIALQAVESRLDAWLADGRLAGLLKPLRNFSLACSASWPPSPAAFRLKSLSPNRQ